MKRSLIVLGLLAALLVGVVAPSVGSRAHAAVPSTAVVTDVPLANSVQTRPTLFDKTRFLIDLGVAYFCIHHVIKNYRNGVYQSGAPGRVRHIAGAAIALAIAYNRLRAAYKTANSSNSATLQRLVYPLNLLIGQVNGTYASLRGDKYSDKDLQGLNNAANGFNYQANRSGYTIKDIATPLPAAS